jgi:hypothetical protein
MKTYIRWRNGFPHPRESGNPARHHASLPGYRLSILDILIPRVGLRQPRYARDPRIREDDKFVVQPHVSCERREAFTEEPSPPLT